MKINMSSLVKEDNPILKEIAKEVETPITKDDLNLLREMAMFVMQSQVKEKDENGDNYIPSIGLSAPQIGISKKMMVIVTPDDNQDLVTLAVINPEITSVSRDNFINMKDGEGCLSVQSIKGVKIPRYKWIRYTGTVVDLKTGETTKKVMSKVEGYLSIVFQHEYDHLLGILITDRAEMADILNKDKKEESK
jgi:peptide deformylase